MDDVRGGQLRQGFPKVSQMFTFSSHGVEDRGRLSDLGEVYASQNQVPPSSSQVMV
jgi:hypothetical protein